MGRIREKRVNTKKRKICGEIWKARKGSRKEEGNK